MVGKKIRFMKPWIIFYIFALIILIFLSQKKLPPIIFPKGAHDNTFGELPLVEVLDDGNFYEKDGVENYNIKPAVKECESIVDSWCNDNIFLIQGKGWEIRRRTLKEKRECFKRKKKICEVVPPDCKKLREIGVGITCIDRKYGGGIAFQ